MYSSITNMSVTASHLRIMFIGALDISFRVSTITLKMLAKVPNKQICRERIIHGSLTAFDRECDRKKLTTRAMYP